ncbi:peptidoglycan editing factor PgeF [bacterium]|nr:peptidoglycan editing factor PgeF [bacterium]
MILEEKNGLKILRSTLFSRFPELVFGFSTRIGGFSKGDFSSLNLSVSVNDKKENVSANRNLFFSALGISQEKIAFSGQVHGERIVFPQNFGLQKECDGLITNKNNVFLTLTGADCYCVFFYEPKQKVVCGVHSGWRGTVQEIVKKAVLKMENEFFCKPNEILAFVTPGISCENFEVGEEVAVNFSENFIKRKAKPFVDLEKVLQKQLLDCGLKKENIELSGLCTYKNEELFFSHRRDKGKTGRMFGTIGIKF